MSADLEEKEDELLALRSIYPEEFVRKQPKFAGEIRVSADIHAEFVVFLKKADSLQQYEISFLPPLLLTFDLPKDYPSSSPPSFTLICSWLTHTQLAALSTQLVQLYQATGGAVVLFSWVQFLRQDALKFLGIHSELEIPVSHGGDLSASRPRGPSTEGAASPVEDDDRLLVGVSPSQALLSRILIHDASERRRVFDGTVFECVVCFLSRRGSDCVQLHECGHIFCQGCLGEFCRLSITEGSVQSLACPQEGCTAAPTPAQVKSLVGEELFIRYDRLLLQSSLDAMSDVAYCPRPSCASAVILEKSSSVALCSACGFAFCADCQKSYHGAEECRPPKRSEGIACTREDKLPESDVHRELLWHDYASGSAERKRLLEMKYGGDVLQFVLEPELSEKWLARNTKHCPHCSRKIQKIGGCNLMTCSQCMKSFCWKCFTRFSPNDCTYRHFESDVCSVYSVY